MTELIDASRTPIPEPDPDLLREANHEPDPPPNPESTRDPDPEPARDGNAPTDLPPDLDPERPQMFTPDESALALPRRKSGAADDIEPATADGAPATSETAESDSAMDADLADDPDPDAARDDASDAPPSDADEFESVEIETFERDVEELDDRGDDTVLTEIEETVEVESAPREDGATRSSSRRSRDRHREERRPRVEDAPRRGRQVMVVNDIPGEECRVAVLENGRLESLFMERVGSATNVGNIYKGRVTNVEPAIQAAFVDFGEGASGFLHISDLHPKYFPGQERTERVGRKIPRRERPLIQDALKKGNEVLVQVLKEGLGSKGPTLTSYLSIPGRLLVAMPDMDRVGVSRKVEDEEQRRAMRKILDQLDLPEGFGFILRTAGFDATKSELARDVAYLSRLWSVMEKRMRSAGAPCELYTEGDLLVRSIRDIADDNVAAIVVDSEEAFLKATAFLRVVAPRAAPKVLFWDRPVPVFHAFDVERQIHMLHSREVPLPSGGALVIDQTEALVAIDVNSGRSRSARDSETNAYQTNIEAVEEIARQLRLRDLGGVIINDLIDMRAPKHRRDIEERFRAALRRDRAKTTVVPISELGVLEMTRQRMRPSVRKTHFQDCPHCHGLGEIKMPETVGADALRDAEFVLATDRVAKVELVCSVKVATVLLSSKRRLLYEIEERTGKRVDVRISEAIALDRVDLYAYDDRDADVDVGRLPRPPKPDLESLPTAPPDLDTSPQVTLEDPRDGGRRRRRRRRKPAPADTTAMILAGGFADLPLAGDDEDEPTIGEAIEAERAAAKEARHAQRQKDTDARQPPASAPAAADGQDQRGGRKRRRRRRRGRGERADAAVEAVAPAPPAPPEPETPAEPILLHLLAKELGVASRELMQRCRDEGGFEIKSHMSKLTAEQVARVRGWYLPPPPSAPPVAPAAATATEEAVDDADESETGEGGGRRRRRRRRRRRGGAGDAAQERSGDKPSRADGSADESRRQPGAQGADRRDGGRPSGADRSGNAAQAKQSGDDGEGGRGRRRRRRRRGRGGDGASEDSRARGQTGSESAAPARAEKPSEARAASAPAPAATPPERPRTLYGGRYRKLGSAASEKARDDE